MLQGNPDSVQWYMPCSLVMQIDQRHHALSHVAERGGFFVEGGFMLRGKQVTWCTQAAEKLVITLLQIRQQS